MATRADLDDVPPAGAGEGGGLLERSGDLAALEASLAKARDGHGSLVLVSGEAGIGKTALAQAFCDAHRGAARVLWGVCREVIDTVHGRPSPTISAGAGLQISP